jgi:transcriptional regulator with XRE-family HTH domain
MVGRETDLQAVGRRVRAARQSAGLSQLKLARTIGVSLSTVVRLERGDGKRVDLHRIREIADVLDADPYTLITGDV